LLVSRWHTIEPYTKHLSRFKLHPQFVFPFKEKFIHSDFDFRTGVLAKESNDPNNLFIQLSKDVRGSLDEVEIYTDGSRTEVTDSVEGSNLVGCAILVPHIETSYSFKLNSMSSSFTAEVLAIDRALQLLDPLSLTRVNICSDSLSVLRALENAERAFFPRSLNKLKLPLAELSYKLSRVNFFENRVRFIWCPAHAGITLNEEVDLLAKKASVNGELWTNDISFGEVISALRVSYDNIDLNYFLSSPSGVGSYYLRNFNEINLYTVMKFSKNRVESGILIRIITGYPGTKSQLFKRQLIDSPSCICGETFQDLNHIFGACPTLDFEREKLFILLRKLNLYDPFSVEYLLGHLNKKIAAIIIKFAMVANDKLNISI